MQKLLPDFPHPAAIFVFQQKRSILPMTTGF
jgi:hypothetical protein